LHKNHTGWVLLVCVILLAGACGDDAPVREAETKAKTAPSAPPLPVREWYPTPKHARPRISIAPEQPAARVPMTQQPSFTPSPAPQQQWNMQPQPYVPVQPQQYQYAYPYQYEQRPWGAVPDSKGRKQTDAGQNSQPQGTATDYWGVPVYPGGQYNGYPPPGMPGYVW
jgi:hypothetical protein